MRFKKNITITAACMSNEILLSSIPAIFIVYSFFAKDNFKGILSTLLVIPYFMLIINGILFLISLVAQLFICEQIYIEKEELIVRNNSGEKVIKYNEIIGISYDFGEYLKRFNPNPSRLFLFGINNEQLLVLDNPSIIMILLLKRHCKNIKISYYNNKRFLFFLILINCLTFFISLLINFFF